MAKVFSQMTPEEQEKKRLRWRNWYALHKEHRRKYKKQYRHEHPEQYRAYGRQRYAKAKDSIRSRGFLDRYGLTVEERDKILATQGGICAACGATEPTKKGWMIDHDHETGQIRGVLCGRCNSALGLLHDDPVKVQKLLQYIQWYKNGPQPHAGSKSRQSEDSNVSLEAIA